MQSIAIIRRIEKILLMPYKNSISSSDAIYYSIREEELYRSEENVAKEGEEKNKIDQVLILKRR